MMQIAKKWIVRASRAAFIKAPGGVRFLLFHEIKASQLETFESVIRFIEETYGFIVPDDYNRYSRMNGIRYIVSFDDGFASELKVTREILDPLGIKALFFICPHFIGLEGKEAADFIKGPMRRSDLLGMTPELQPLSWNDLNSLSTTGHVIGSHSMNHSRLSEQRTEGDLIDEIVSPADFLEKKLSRKIDWFAYPFGDITSIDPQSLQMIGRRYRYCCSGLRGINTGSTHRLCLTREEIDLDLSLDHLKQIITGGLDFYYFFKRRKLSQMTHRGNPGSDGDSS